MREKRLVLKLTVNGILKPFDCELAAEHVSSDIDYEERLVLSVDVDINTFDEESLEYFSRSMLLVHDRDDPDGRTRFDGFLMDYSIDYETGRLEVELRSWSNDFNSRVFEETATEDYNSGATYSGSTIYDLGTSGKNTAIVSRITTDAATAISFITLKLWVEISNFSINDFTATLTLHETLADAQNLDSNGIKSSTIRVFDTWPKEFSFPMDDVAVSTSTDYFVRVVCDLDSLNYMIPSSSQHASDLYYVYDNDTATWNVRTGQIIYARVYTQTGNTVFTYSDVDVAEILRDIIDSQQLYGGQIEYTGLTIPDTGVVTDMQFSTQMQSEAIYQCMTALGKDYLFTIDSATNLAWLHYLPDKTTDHTIVKGRSTSGLKVRKSAESIYSDIFFTGGDTGAGTNLYKRYSNLTTRQIYRNRSQSYQDGRIKVEGTADEIANELLSRGADVNVIVEATLGDNNFDLNGYDIESYKIGDVVKIAGVNDPGRSSLWDVMKWDEDSWDYDITSLSTVTLAIRSIVYKKDQISVLASSLNIAQFSVLKGMRKDLVQQLVEDNPDAPI